MNARDKTTSQEQVEEFMAKAGQAVPAMPTIPDEPTRLLRAKLIWEEAIRVLVGEGLAVDIQLKDAFLSQIIKLRDKTDITFSIATNREPNLELIADGAADTEVVVKGTLAACGIADAKLQEIVNESNLAKFTTPNCPECGNPLKLVENYGGSFWECGCAVYPLKHFGGYSSDGSDGNPVGKWVKPKSWVAPDIAGLLKEQAEEPKGRFPVSDTPKVTGEYLNQVYYAGSPTPIQYYDTPRPLANYGPGILAEVREGSSTGPDGKIALNFVIAEQLLENLRSGKSITKPYVPLELSRNTAQPPYVVNVPAVAREFIGSRATGPKSHRGWWATLEEPDRNQIGNRIEFRSNSELIEEGTFTNIYFQGAIMENDPAGIFTNWYKIEYKPDADSLRLPGDDVT